MINSLQKNKAGKGIENFTLVFGLVAEIVGEKSNDLKQERPQ